MNRAFMLMVAAGALAFAQTPCEQLQSLKLPDTTLTQVTTVRESCSATGSARWRPGRGSPDAPDAAGLLPSARDPQTVAGLGHQDRSLAADRRGVEWKI